MVERRGQSRAPRNDAASMSLRPVSLAAFSDSGPFDAVVASRSLLHTADAMLRELERRFNRRLFASARYLYGELSGALGPSEERALIEAGEIQATGFR